MANHVFVHEKGLCDSTQVGDGTRIWAFAHVLEGAVVGSGCNICEGCFIESGAVVGDDCTIKNGVSIWEGVTLENLVFLGPNAVLTNDFLPRSKVRRDYLPTLIRQGATIGANATVVCGVTIGRYAMVGAGSVITRDVPDHALVFGNPARRHGWVCECGLRIEPGTPCEECGKRYVLDGERLTTG